MPPQFKGLLRSWDPLAAPAAFTATLRAWRALLKTTPPPAPETRVDVYGARTVSAPVPVYASRLLPAAPTLTPHSETPMTPFEALLWHAWVPKIRSTINSWSPADAPPLVALYEAWAALLPPFVRDNFFDQLVLPRVAAAVAAWTPAAPAPLGALVFPWLPHVGLRADALLDDARRRVRARRPAARPARARELARGAQAPRGTPGRG
jgi:tuftelin-interacting protein 11